jgi:hypothetical protein
MSETSTRSAAETLTFADILAQAKPAQRSIFMHLRGDLLARRDELDAEVEEAARLERLAVRNAEGNPELALGESSPTDQLVAELRDVMDELRASRVRFTFEALPRSKWDALRKEHEQADGKTNLDTMAVPLVAATLVHPAATEDEITQLYEKFNHLQRQQMFDAAWEVNTGAVDIPFSLAGSAAEKAPRSGKR